MSKEKKRTEESDNDVVEVVGSLLLTYVVPTAAL